MRLLKDCLHEEQQKLILINEVAERMFTWRAAKTNFHKWGCWKNVFIKSSKNFLEMRLLKECLHEEQQKLILINEVAEGIFTWRAASAEGPHPGAQADMARGKRGRSSVSIHNLLFLLACRLPLLACLLPHNLLIPLVCLLLHLLNKLLLFLVACPLLHQSQPSSVSSCLSPTSPPPPYPCLDPFYLVNLQPPRHHHLRLI